MDAKQTEYTRRINAETADFFERLGKVEEGLEVSHRGRVLTLVATFAGFYTIACETAGIDPVDHLRALQSASAGQHGGETIN